MSTTFFDFEWDSNYHEGILERGDLRAVLIRDLYPDAPYFDGGDPILDSDDGRQRYGMTVPDSILEAFGKTERGSWGYREWEVETFERYVRIFHGGKVSWMNGGSRGEEGRYAVLALPELRRTHGFPEDRLHDDPDPLEWTAYVEGDVYGLRVERRLSEETIIRDLDGTEVDRDAHDVWVPVEYTEVWGHYGDDYAVQAALEALAEVEGAEAA